MNMQRHILGMAIGLMAFSGSFASMHAQSHAGSDAASGKLPPVAIDSFLEKHCFECHDEDVSKGDLDLTGLDFDLNHHGNFVRWERVYDRVLTGEMPPKKKKAPAASEKDAFLKKLKAPLLAVDLEHKKTLGRVKSRRLTRREYEHSMHDLLGIDLPLSEQLPEDPATHGFETVASGQQLSHHHLGYYLDAADIALEEAFKRLKHGDTKWNKHYDSAAICKGINSGPGGNYRGPEHRRNRAYTWPIRLQFYGRLADTRVPESGWYRITIKDLQSVNAKTPSVWGILKSGSGRSDNPLLFPITTIEATKKPQTVSFDAWIREDHLLQLALQDATVKRVSNGSPMGGDVSYNGRDLIKQGTTGFSITGLTLERIYPNAARWEVRKRVYGAVTYKDIEQAKSPQDKSVLLKKVLATFASHAFRRPVTETQLKPYLALAEARLKETDPSFASAVRVAMRAILCSPRFLVLTEKPGELDDYALATRLSYMLWNTVPDAKLRKIADQKILKQSGVLKRQIKRLLTDKKADRFIKSFTDQWLTFREFDATSPDQNRFRQWDDIVKESMLEETRAYVKELIEKDLSVRYLIHSDFGMLNERLARHYEMKGLNLIPGKGIQRVVLKDGIRGGLITQGAVLKVTANGTTTSPITRGVWVNERILGEVIPPPPPNIPAIEPDIRGAVSIRDQLNKHRSDESCASCHIKIDPVGFALENFDPVGVYRTKYSNHKKARTVDPSGVTPDGIVFKHMPEWKAIYLKRPEVLARGFAEQLLTYATGAPPHFSDREAIEQIVEDSRQSNFGIRTILIAAIESELFKHK